MANGTSYGENYNLTEDEKKKAQTQPVVFDASYASNTPYADQTEDWWKEQYANASDDATKSLVQKYATFYGYNLSQPAQQPTPAATPSYGGYDTYEQYLAKQADSAKQSIETARQKAAIDANTAYQQSKSTYGAKAEALASMGLKGSGYADYLDSQAYATYRAEQQNANATAEYQKQAVQSEYEKNLMDYQQSKKDTYASFLEKAMEYSYDKDGNVLGVKYSSNQLEKLAKAAGLDDSQISDIKAISDDLNYAQIASLIRSSYNVYGVDYDALAALDEIKNANLVNDNVYSRLKEVVEKERVKAYQTAIQEAKDNNDLVLAEKLQSELNSFTTNSANQGQVSNDNQSNVSNQTTQEVLNNYAEGSANVTKGGWFIQGLGSGRENDDVDITIGSTDRKFNEEFDLVCGPAVKEEALKSALNTLATGNANKTPSIEGESWRGIEDASMKKIDGVRSTDKDKENKLVVYKNKMYLYTTKGWVELKDDNRNGELQKAIKAYLGK